LPDGLLIIDKPEGPTSHDVVARARRAIGERRIGHTGTLDPLATGVLALLLGRATRLAQFLTAEDKRYVADIRFGQATTTYDRQGEPVGPQLDAAGLTREAVESALERFRGTYPQTPPPYSAKKVGGISAHRLARRGEAPALAPVTITVSELTLAEFVHPDARVELRCSAGFYVRSLAHDLGTALGCGAHLRSLRRTASGTMDLAGAVSLADLETNRQAVQDAIRPLSTLLAAWPAVRVTVSGVDKVRRGLYLSPSDYVPSITPNVRVSDSASGTSAVTVRVLDPDGALVALGAWVRPARAEGRPQTTTETPTDSANGAGPWFLHPRVVLV
jgi:tRNA pseudouridine55 synthase